MVSNNSKDSINNNKPLIRTVIMQSNNKKVRHEECHKSVVAALRMLLSEKVAKSFPIQFLIQLCLGRNQYLPRNT